MPRLHFNINNFILFYFIIFSILILYTNKVYASPTLQIKSLTCNGLDATVNLTWNNTTGGPYYLVYGMGNNFMCNNTQQTCNFSGDELWGTDFSVGYTNKLWLNSQCPYPHTCYGSTGFAKITDDYGNSYSTAIHFTLPNCTPTTPTSKPTNIPTPTNTPGPTPTPTPASAATATVAAYFEGIDQYNNTTPADPTGRKLTLYFYTSNNFSGTATYIATDLLTFQNSPDINGNEYYWSNRAFSLGNIKTGSYYVLAKSPEGSLRELLSPNPISITASTSNNIINPTAQGVTIPVLRMGDINNDNKVDGLDYNLVVECYGYNKSTGYVPPNCPINSISDSIKGLFADINDDGLVDGIDYNMVLINFGSSGY